MTKVNAYAARVSFSFPSCTALPVTPTTVRRTKAKRRLQNYDLYRCSSNVAWQEVAEDSSWISHADLHVIQCPHGCARVQFFPFDEIGRDRIERR